MDFLVDDQVLKYEITLLCDSMGIHRYVDVCIFRDLETMREGRSRGMYGVCRTTSHGMMDKRMGKP